MTITCRWSASIDVECPICLEEFDYIQTDHFSEIGFEHLPTVAKGGPIKGAGCPNCGHEFDFVIEDGL